MGSAGVGAARGDVIPQVPEGGSRDPSGRGSGRHCGIRRTRPPGSLPEVAWALVGAVTDSWRDPVNIYLVAAVSSVLKRSSELPAGLQMRQIAETDIDTLAALYLRAYDLPDADLDAAVSEMQSAFDGTWGALWPQASPAAYVGDDLVAVVQTVRRPSMSDAPSCPWLIEVFTDPSCRRIGLARGLIGAACGVVASAGEAQVGLTVDDTNRPAAALYSSLGFMPT